MDDMTRDREIGDFALAELSKRSKAHLVESNHTVGKMMPVGVDEYPMLTPFHNNRSDGEIVFNFESADDAKALFDFMVGASTGVKLVEPGLIILTTDVNQYTVSFAPSVMVWMPEVIEAAIIAYWDKIQADSEALESVKDSVLLMLTEAKKTSTREIQRKGIAFGVPGNPYHGADDGKFASKEALSSTGKGSWSKGNVQRKVKGKSKTGVSIGVTKTPCGRPARGKGKNVRCWDGQELTMSGSEMARILKKKTKRESIERDDFIMLETISKVFEKRLAEAKSPGSMSEEEWLVRARKDLEAKPHEQLEARIEELVHEYGKHSIGRKSNYLIRNVLLALVSGIDLEKSPNSPMSDIQPRT